MRVSSILILGLSLCTALATGCPSSGNGGGVGGIGGVAGTGGVGGTGGTGGTLECPLDDMGGVAGAGGIAYPLCNDGMAQAKTVTVGCRNSVTNAQSPFPYDLSVRVESPIVRGCEFDALLDGVGFFPEFFLDNAQLVIIPGGVRVAEIADFAATVQVRSGATGADVVLDIDVDALVPGPTRLCNFPEDQECTADSECLGGTCNDPVNLQNLPILEGTPNSEGGCVGTPTTDCDCAACLAIDVDRGTCTPADSGSLVCTKENQCLKNGFCISGPLTLELAEATATYTAGAPGGQVRWGWADQNVPGLILCPAETGCGLDFHVDGCYQLPPPISTNPTEPIGIRLSAGGLDVNIQCGMAEDGGECTAGDTGTGIGCLCDDSTDVDGECTSADCESGETCIGVGQDNDIVCPTPDETLISCPVN